MTVLNYLLEANLYLVLFYLLYYLLLSRETFHTANRLYLLLSPVLAFVLPYLQLGYLKPPIAADTETTLTRINNIVETAAVTPQEQQFTVANYLFWLYMAGVIISVGLLCIKLFKLYRLIKKGNPVKMGSYTLVHIDEDNTAFSFFNYLFAGRNYAGAGTIMQHEVVHIKQLHSADILFAEILKCLNWFNPAVYMLQNSLKALHEYIADDKTAAQQSKLDYSSFLVDNACGHQPIQLAHSFFNYKLLKKRIVMLNQQRSGKLARLKYLLAVPLGAGMLCASTLSFSKDYPTFDIFPQQKDAMLKVSKGNTNLGKQKALTVEVLQPDTGRRSTKSNKKLPPPPPLKVARPPKPKIENIKFPPPVLKDNPFANLILHAYNYAKYPATEIAAGKEGTVVVEFTIDNDGKVNSEGIYAGVSEACNAEALRVVKSFTGVAGTAKPGSYKLLFEFFIPGSKKTAPPAPPIEKGQNIGSIKIPGVRK